MIRVAKSSVIIADLNKRGEAVINEVHRLDGREHEKSKMSLSELKKFFRESGLSVKVYRDTCQMVFIAKKG
jgi:hypothetical protein